MKLTDNMKKGLIVAGAAMVGTTVVTGVIRYQLKKRNREMVVDEVCNESTEEVQAEQQAEQVEQAEQKVEQNNEEQNNEEQQ